MELEEAINNLKKYIEEDFIYKEPIKNMSDFDRFCYNHCKDIEIVLQALENSVSKDIIREKINERQFELHQEYKDFKDDIRLNTLQEIYYINEEDKQ